MKKAKSNPDLSEEKKLWKIGYKYVIGADEVGRGSFAGPVVAAAVIIDKEILRQPHIRRLLTEVNDSKLLTAKKREELAPLIKKHSLAYSISTVRVSVINKNGIGKATEIAFRKAITGIINNESGINNNKNSKFLIPNSKFFLLVDGFHIKYVKGVGLKKQKAIKKGDQKSVSIAAASIIAKVYRDKLMVNLSKKYPKYGFEIHKGYGTKKHRNAIIENGVTKIHRTVFCNTFLSHNPDN